jgi:PAS domain S-box-containing protein
MKNIRQPAIRIARIKFHILLGAVFWTAIIGLSLLWNILYINNQTLSKANIMTNLAFDKDVSFRNWLTFHGGVYVPATRETVPNPYLNVLERDILLPTGKSLTLMNPAYVMRQYYVKFEKNEDVKGHITSLKPLRPENRPDSWEEQSLRDFEAGKKETTTIQIIDGREYVRFMKPFITIKGCLKCHASQGYKEGEIRGGISVSVTMDSLRKLERSQVAMVSTIHVFLWGLILGGIFFLGSKIMRSELKRFEAENELIASEKSLAEAQRIAHIGNWEWNIVSNKLHGSTEMYQVFGRPPQSLTAYEDFLNSIHPDDREYAKKSLNEAINGGKPYNIHHRIVLPDGEMRYVEEQGEVRFDESRRPVVMLGTAQDITERKRAEEALRKIRDLLNATGRMAKVGGWELDIKTLKLVWTEEVYLIHEVDMSYEPTVSKAIDFYGPQSRPIIEQAVQRAIEHGEPFNLELEFITAKNNHRWVHAIGDADQEHFKVFGTFQDISERKQLEEALQKSHDELEEQVRERTAELVKTNEEVRRISGKLLSAHEEERKRIAGEIHDILGSGLSAIKFKIEDVMQRIGNASNVVSEYLDPVVPLIQETIAECRRIQMNLRPPMLDDLGLLPTLSWFFRRFQTIYPNISVEQAMDIEEEDVPGPLKIVIFRVIQEAVNNAAKYSQADLVGQSLRKQDGQMELVIRDNGRGFDLGEAFYPKRARKGLGLTSIKERVELSGGYFFIESTEGKGTVIRAVWPV